MVFPEADAVGEPIDEPPVVPVLRDGETVGYVFETNDIAPIPAYSGHPVNMRVGMALDGRITGVEVLDHSEPIMLVGIPETVLDDFVGQYSGKSVHQKVRVGLSRQRREGYEHVDAISGATVTVVVMGEGIMRSARRVARELGILTARVAEPATVREDVFEEANWDALLEEGALGRLHLTRGEVDEAFIGTDAEGIDAAPEGREDETFIDLYFAYLNVPTVGRNLLGDRQFEQLMEGLAEDEHALAIMANGRYSFKGSGFVRGGIYDRIMVHTVDGPISFTIPTCIVCGASRPRARHAWSSAISSSCARRPASTPASPGSWSCWCDARWGPWTPSSSASKPNSRCPSASWRFLSRWPTPCSRTRVARCGSRCGKTALLISWCWGPVSRCSP
ncbi:MAG: FMN-binding protein [Halomonas sp.]|nr:FMN-binding protein [Halomonas sp.]